MTPEQWRRVNDLYHAALDTPVPHREQFVREHASGDEVVARELQRLLDIDPEKTAVVDKPAGNLGSFLSPVIAPGDHLANRYRILGEVGAGGMGQVYEAVDDELKTRVALKIIRPELANEPRVVARFKQEVQLARQVTHPNVCRAFDLIRVTHRERELLILCMEFVEGETLSTKLRRDGKMKIAEAAPIIAQITAGLAAAHAAGVVHRDLKSGNIFLSKTRDGEMRVVLADFGLAGNLAREEGASQQTASGWGVGTPAYMAPEQVEGGKIGPAADIYALGVVMYEMATGHVPYEGQTPLQVAVRRLREKPRPPRELDASIDGKWESAILRCLEVEPADRFAGAEEVARALHQVRWLPRLPRWAWRPRRVIAGSLAGLAVLVAGAFYLTTAPALSVEAARWYDLGVASLHEGAPLTALKRLEQAAKIEPDAAVVHARLAEAYLELDMADRARDSLLRAAQLAPDRWRLSSGNQHLMAAIQARALRDFPVAARELKPLTQAGGAPERASAWLDLGRVHAEAGQTAEALSAFEESARLDPQSAAARLQSAMMLARQQKMTEADKLFDAASRLFDLAGNKEGIAETLAEKGRALRDSRRLTEAAAILANAMAAAKAAGSPALEAKVLFAQSVTELRTGEFSLAEGFAKRGLELANGQQMEFLAIRGLNDLGQAAFTQYKLEEADKYLRQAIELAGKTRNLQGLAMAKSTMASLMLLRGESSAALPLVREALGYYRQANFQERVLLLSLLEVNALMDSGELGESGEAALRLRRLAEKLGNEAYTALAIERVAYRDRLAGNYRASVEGYEVCAAGDRTAGRKSKLAHTLANLGSALDGAGDSRRETVWREAAQLIDGLGVNGTTAKARLAQVRAESALRAGRYREAAQLAGEALGNAKDSQGRRALALTVLASARMHLGQSADALNAANEAVALARGKGMADVDLPAQLEWARVKWRRGDRAEALKVLLEIRDRAVKAGAWCLAARASALGRVLGRPELYPADRAQWVALAGAEVVAEWERSAEFRDLLKGSV